MTRMAEQTNMATEEVTITKRRRWPWMIGAALAIIALVVVVAVVVAPEPEPESTDADGGANTAEAVRTDLVDETTYDGTLGTTEDNAIVAPTPGVISATASAGSTISAGEIAFAIDGEPVVLLSGEEAAFRDFRLAQDTLSVAARATGTVTELVEQGMILEQGDVIARIDGEPVVLLYGDIPMYRTLQDLSDNLTGDDVQQLEQALTDLGYNDGIVTVDQEFTQATQDLVELWQDDLGVEDDGVVTVADIVFVPGPAQVVGTVAAVGDRVTEGTPVVTLTSGDATEGPDVEQLETALAALGFDANAELLVDGIFDIATAEAIRELETSVGARVDGMISAGEVRFSSSAVKVTEVNADVGTTVTAGTPIVSLSSPDKIVVFDLPAADQGLVGLGDAVTVELPSGEEVAGTVSFVAESATTSADQLDAVFEIEVMLDDPSVAADLEQAPVDVSVVSDSVADVVAVPVSALIALAEGGYAVEIVESGGATRLVAVEPGFYAQGLVEIESDSVQPGTVVVVP